VCLGVHKVMLQPSIMLALLSSSFNPKVDRN
jgi:hypothetical protein